MMINQHYLIVNVNYELVMDLLNVMMENDDQELYSLVMLYYVVVNDLVDEHDVIVLVNDDVHDVNFHVDLHQVQKIDD
jgi:hypothetical protein